MKLSLTFEPTVKPLYKQFCIQKIQQTVNSIKQHLKFSKKQNIYQSEYDHQAFSKENNCSFYSTTLLDKTVKKNPNFNDISHISQNTDQGCIDQKLIRQSFEVDNPKFPKKFRKNTQDNKQSYTQILTQLKQSTQKIQKKQYGSHFKKVERTMQYHTNFYENIIQKLNLMTQKQVKLQALIEQLKLLKASIDIDKTRNIKIHEKDNQQFSEKLVIASPTFRNNNFSIEKEEKFFKDLVDNECISNKITDFKKCGVPKSSGKIEKQSQQLYNLLMNEQEQCERNVKPLSTLKTSQATKKLTKSSIISKNIKKSENFRYSMASTIPDCHDISETAEFLFNFMKLESQFNKIKKNSIFKNGLGGEISQKVDLEKQGFGVIKINH